MMQTSKAEPTGRSTVTIELNNTADVSRFTNSMEIESDCVGAAAMVNFNGVSWGITNESPALRVAATEVVAEYTPIVGFTESNPIPMQGVAMSEMTLVSFHEIGGAFPAKSGEIIPMKNVLAESIVPKLNRNSDENP